MDRKNEENTNFISLTLLCLSRQPLKFSWSWVLSNLHVNVGKKAEI